MKSIEDTTGNKQSREKYYAFYISLSGTTLNIVIFPVKSISNQALKKQIGHMLSDQDTSLKNKFSLEDSLKMLRKDTFDWKNYYVKCSPTQRNIENIRFFPRLFISSCIFNTFHSHCTQPLHLLMTHCITLIFVKIIKRCHNKSF
jgi:hypothetical protein